MLIIYVVIIKNTESQNEEIDCYTGLKDAVNDVQNYFSQLVANDADYRDLNMETLAENLDELYGSISQENNENTTMDVSFDDFIISIHKREVINHE
jgi:hypothetical protein